MTAHLLNLNGEVLEANAPLLTTQNRAFRYGDALFESIRCMNGRLPFLPLHIERLVGGMKVLKMNIPAHFDTVFFQAEIEKILPTTTANVRIRITIMREEGGFYAPISHNVLFLIEYAALTDDHFLLNKRGLKVDLFNDFIIHADGLSTLKHTNKLVYVMAAISAVERGLDDVLLKNKQNNIVEASSSNIFWRRGYELYTVPLFEGCVSGVMRKWILRKSSEMGENIIQKALTLSELHLADEIFITNAIQGVRWVQHIGEHFYCENEATKIWNDRLNTI